MKDRIGGHSSETRKKIYQDRKTEALRMEAAPRATSDATRLSLQPPNTIVRHRRTVARPMKPRERMPRTFPSSSGPNGSHNGSQKKRRRNLMVHGVS